MISTASQTDTPPAKPARVRRLGAALGLLVAGALGVTAVGIATGSTAAGASPQSVSTSVAQVAAADFAGTFTLPSSTTRWLQKNLARTGYLPLSGVDGSYGPQTTAAVKIFQGHQCIAQDGKAGPITQGKLTTLVKKVQAKVGTTQDGDFGPNTTTAVKAWQRSHGLAVDGIAGPLTMRAMGIVRVNSCDPSTPPPASSDLGARIASIATAQLNDNSRNREIGGYNCNFYTTAMGERGTGGYCSNGWKTEAWCADFSEWVWKQAGVTNRSGLNPLASSFASYGRANGTFHRYNPKVGDAVTFDYQRDGVIDHVGLVVSVSSSNVAVISGNSRGTHATSAYITKISYSISSSAIVGFTSPKR